MEHGLETRVYVPTRLLEHVVPLIRATQQGFTQLQGAGCWYDGERYVNEPVGIICMISKTDLRPLTTLIASEMKRRGESTVLVQVISTSFTFL